jgi:GGDEF domain-containing protein
LDASPAARSAPRGALRARNTEIASQLRAAVLYDDDVRVTRLLSQLLQPHGLPEGQRVSLQLKALLNVVNSLRSAASSDELTGLYNRHTFLQVSARLLAVATRHRQSAHLVYLNVEGPWQARKAAEAAHDVALRHTGRLLRDLFPDYGVYEILGRIGPGQFAALTLREDYESRLALLSRAFGPRPASHDSPDLPLQVGIAHFNPQRPVAIDELLADAREALRVRNDVDETSRSEEHTSELQSPLI